MIASWVATGPWAMVCVAPWRVCATAYALKFCGHALPYEEERVDNQHRQQQVEDAPHEVHPERANSTRRPARQASDQRNGCHNARRRGHPVVSREPGHLGEVAHRCLTRVVLPVRVGRKTGRGVPGQHLRHIGEVLRVEESAVPLLGTLDNVGDQQPHNAEREDRQHIGVPAHFFLLVDPSDLVDPDLDRSQHDMKKGALAGEDLVHVAPHRFGE